MRWTRTPCCSNGPREFEDDSRRSCRGVHEMSASPSAARAPTISYKCEEQQRVVSCICNLERERSGASGHRYDLTIYPWRSSCFVFRMDQERKIRRRLSPMICCSLSSLQVFLGSWGIRSFQLVHGCRKDQSSLCASLICDPLEIARPPPSSFPFPSPLRLRPRSFALSRVSTPQLARQRTA